MESELSHQFKFINPHGKPYIKASLIRPIIHIFFNFFFFFLNKYKTKYIIYIYILKRPFFSYKYNKRMLCKKIKVLKLCILKIKL